tara:strand:+ start:2592 stop:3221 length:630 start_codon:yes stop_codon:yes gene_type:complete
MSRSYKKRKINWKLSIFDRNHPKNSPNYKSILCDNFKQDGECLFYNRGQCLFYHNEEERDHWNSIRQKARKRRYKIQPAVIDDLEKINDVNSTYKEYVANIAERTKRMPSEIHLEIMRQDKRRKEKEEAGKKAIEERNKENEELEKAGIAGSVARSSGAFDGGRKKKRRGNRGKSPKKKRTKKGKKRRIKRRTKKRKSRKRRRTRRKKK